MNSANTPRVVFETKSEYAQLQKSWTEIASEGHTPLKVSVPVRRFVSIASNADVAKIRSPRAGIAI